MATVQNMPVTTQHIVCTIFNKYIIQNRKNNEKTHCSILISVEFSIDYNEDIDFKITMERKKMYLAIIILLSTVFLKCVQCY